MIRQTIERMQKGRKEEKEPDDSAKKWLTRAEYDNLPTVHKYQLALDRYWRKKKQNGKLGVTTSDMLATSMRLAVIVFTIKG